ncbi:MAG: hypothetical protein D6718_09190 [Acidobacteria bacterium]|nr:MAG: hypothetical protein D6718_09190 [Acidobacteriota bacterium]
MKNEAHGRATMRPSQVCQELRIQPYVLKFWEGEIPQLGERVGRKRLYGPLEREIAAEIHRVIEVEKGTIAQAREHIARRYPLGAERPPAGKEATPAAEDLAEARARIRDLERQLSAQADLERQLREAVAARRRLAEEVRRLERELEQAREAARQREARVSAFERELEAACRELEEIEALAAGLLGPAEGEETAREGGQPPLFPSGDADPAPGDAAGRRC